jgi:hypothetical protein
LKKSGGSVLSRFPIAKMTSTSMTGNTACPSKLGRPVLGCRTQPANPLLNFAPLPLAFIINGWRCRMCTGGRWRPWAARFRRGIGFPPQTILQFCYSARVTTSETAAQQKRAGLCADCLHSRRIESDRGSIFFLCQLALSNPQFQKYPRLPVLSCPGYEKTRQA